MKRIQHIRLASALTTVIWLMAASLLPAQRPGAQGGGGGRMGAGGDRSGGQSGSYGAQQMGDAVIQFDPETGSLIVIADDETNAQIAKVVENLDQPVPQVLIKVLFLEVTYNNGLDLGVEGAFRFDSTKDQDLLRTVFGLAGETRGGFYQLLEEDLDVTLRAIAETGKLEVLSRPSVLTRNNQEAVITVGQEVPFIRNSRITEQGQTINTIEYEDIGIILRVTPHITSDRLVEMEVLPEISTLTGDTIAISETVNARVIAKRSAETRVVVADGETVVIGGMMEDNNTSTVRKVPLLGDIPYLGALFRRTITSKAKTELLIFLTPRVVERPSDLRAMSLKEKGNTELTPQAFPDKLLDRYVEGLEE